MTVTVLGAGAFGTALAIAIARTQPVRLWARNADTALHMEKTRTGPPQLAEVLLPETVHVTPDLGAALDGDGPVLIAIPMQRLYDFATEHSPQLAGRILVACCKGVDLARGLGPTGILRSVFDETEPAVLTGPSFAADIAVSKPTALVLACRDDNLGERLQSRLSTPVLRLYRSTDTTGADLGGALKNVIAIACGAIVGAGLGDSARAALTTRGFAEMQRYAIAQGARAETLAGLSGFGDLVLTCTSETSRNFRFGHAIGCGDAFDPNITVEGAATARAVTRAASGLGLEMPITETVVALLDESTTMADATDRLMRRPLKEE